MTLRKQLLLIIIIVFTLVFIGTLVISIHNFKGYLVHTLEKQSQNTASALGASLTNMQHKDPKVLEGFIKPIFTTGHYKGVIVKDVNGNVIFKQMSEDETGEAPLWFKNRLSLRIHPGEGFISSGQKQIGIIYVYGDLNDAYDHLWHHIIQTFWWFCISGILTLLFTFAALRYLIQPLRDIKIQADAICNRNFSIQNKIPHIKELAVVVNTMNKVSKKMQKMFNQQTELAEHLREQAFKDPVTNLANRRYLNMKLEHFLNSPDEFYTGALILLHIRNLQEYKKTQGYEAYEIHLKRIAYILNEFCTPINQFIPCRVSDSHFALLTTHLERDEVKALIQSLHQKLNKLDTQLDLKTIKYSLGGAIYHPGLSATELLSEADMALRAAELKNNNNWHIFDTSKPELVVKTASSWNQYFENIIASKNIIIHFQPIMNIAEEKKSPIQYEVLLRLPDDNGKLLNAGTIIPMAENLDKMVALDKLVVLKTLEFLKTNPNTDAKFAINLSPASISKVEFIEWLVREMNSNQEYINRFAFELPDYIATQFLDIFQTIIDRLTALGCQFSLDHFGRSLSSFQYLKNVNVNYIKIDGSYIRHIDKNNSNQLLLELIAELAHNLKILIIAEQVETKEEYETLKALQIDAVQGYYIGKPMENIVG